MDTELNVIDLYEIITTDFDVAAFQDAVRTSGITHFFLSLTAQIPRTVKVKLSRYKPGVAHRVPGS